MGRRSASTVFDDEGAVLLDHRLGEGLARFIQRPFNDDELLLATFDIGEQLKEEVFRWVIPDNTGRRDGSQNRRGHPPMLTLLGALDPPAAWGTQTTDRRS